MITQSIAFIDIETTGLDSTKHEIIELAAVIAKMKDGVLTVTGELDIKIMPKRIEDADPQALRINGYNDADWLFAVSIEEGMKMLMDKADGAVFAAHNATFDYGFIEANLRRYDIENTMHYHRLDTLSIAFAVQHNADDIGRLSLKALCEKYGIENKRAHSAFADAYATYEVFKKMLNLK